MKYPQIIIDTKKIEYNAKTIVKLCNSFNIKVFGVTKVTCANIKVAESLKKAGTFGLADSRIENLKKLRKHFGKKEKLLMLRLPMHSEIDDIVEYCDYSLNSEISTIKYIDNICKLKNKTHKIILMIDIGDLREGIWPDNIDNTITEILKLKNIKLAGLGVNLACYGGVFPTEKNMNLFSNIIKKVKKEFNIEFELISGGNSSGLPFLKTGKMPENITMFRIGETIMLGVSVFDRSKWENCYQDTFILKAEIIELKKKPSVPIGKRGQDAFGNTVEFEDKGIIKRAICGIGRQDISIDGLFPIEKGVEILGGSSDHLILNLQNCKKEFKVGDIIEFRLSYGALLTAMTSNYVKKAYIGELK